ncbi:MAG: hypothetical protein QXD69_02180 [Candidatus Bathyarchaeia archaeon]
MTKPGPLNCIRQPTVDVADVPDAAQTVKIESKLQICPLTRYRDVLPVWQNTDDYID